jgi:hypothetical protein
MAWHKIKIAYQQEQENGQMKNIAEVYLVAAVSFTDAETRIYELVADSIPDFKICTINEVKISDIFDAAQSEKYYMAKVVFENFDAIKDKTKRFVSNMLVAANDIADAWNIIQDKLKAMLIPYDIEKIGLTPIIAIYGAKTNDTKGDDLS